MQELSSDNLSLFAQHVAIKLRQPIMIRGRAGVGKSAIVNALSKRLNSKRALDALLGEANNYTGTIICDVRLSQYESVDLRGFPGVNRETGFTVWHAPSTLPFIGNDEFPDDKLIILFLDELTSASPPVFSVAYQLINENRVGEHVLKPNVVIICAGNREDDQGVVNRMPFPLANRMTWVEAIVSHTTWSDWAMDVGIDPVVIAFVNFKPILLHTFEPGKAEKCVATPRTWEKAAAYYVDAMPEEIKWTAISGAIGAGPAAELQAFIKVWRKVTPIKDILRDPEGVKVPAEADMRYATAVSVSGAMETKTTTALYKFMTRMPAEMMVLCWQLALKRDASLTKTPEYMAFCKAYRSVFSL